MLIKTKYIDCASKSIFETWKLPTSAADTSGDIYWSAIVYIKDTGEMWTHGRLYGGFFSNADSNKVSLTIGGTEKILALDGHVQHYTTLTGSGSVADQAILSTGVANKWALKTLGKNAFSNVDYLPADATAVAAEKVVHAMTFQYNGNNIHSFDGSVARILNIIQGDNVFVTGDGQGNITIAADPGSDTVNTAGATNLIDRKLFLIGAESQTASPQTYSNQYVYIGTDNCLYSLGKKVLTEHQAIYNLDLQTQVGELVTKVTTFDPNAANNSFTLVQGTNVTLTPDATNKKVTISSKDTTYDFYNLIFKQGDSVIDTYKPTTSPSKTFKAGTNVTLSGSNNEVIITTLDTRNTAGAKDKLATKLFLTGSLTQTDNPQTYTNSKVYIGVDNKLYSDGKVVSTGDHTHNYAGATTPGGPALKIDLNPSGLLDATYGSYGGILQDSNKGPTSGSWSNRIKILHNNSTGYYTELAQAMTGTAGLWHRRNVAGTVSEWTPVIDKANFHTYLDNTYVIRGNDPNVLTNYVRYSLASGLTMNWEWGNATPTHIWGAKGGDSSKAYVFNGDNIRAFANAVNRAGDTMTGGITFNDVADDVGLKWNKNTDYASIYFKNTSDSDTNSYLGFEAGDDGNEYFRFASKSGSTVTEWLTIKGDGVKFKGATMWHSNNDGSGSGLDADLLDGIQENKLYRSNISTVDGESNLANIPATRSGSYVLTHSGWSGAVHVFYAGGSNSTFGFMLPGGGNSTVKVISTTDSSSSKWKTLGDLAYLTSNVASATRADYPTGFTSKLSSATWGNQDGTFVTGWGGPGSADIQFRNNNGKLNVIIDGSFYQDEGKYKVLDTNNYSSTLDSRYLLKGSSVTANNNSSWLSFANDAGGIGGTMGTNDQWRIYGRSTASNSGYLEIATADDAAEPIYVRQYSGIFATLSRTLTLLDATGNTSMPGTATAGNFNTAGRYTTSYASGTWINSVTNSALTVNMGDTYGGIWCAPVKGGRVAMSVYPSSNNNVYLGYASDSQISAGTNSFNRQTYWNADDGIWRSGGFAKDSSNDTYVLLGGGGHTTLSSLGSSHTHSIFRNNLIIKGTNGISDTASIHLALGDSDTGFKWISDGVVQMYANNVPIGQWNSTCMNWYKTPQVNGTAVSLNGHTHNYITSSGLRDANSNGSTRGESGVRLYGAYNNNYPTTYGAVLHLHEGRGAAELLLGWSGSDGAHVNNYIRSKRDNDSGAWSGWAKIYTDANLNINNLTARYLAEVEAISNLDSPGWYNSGNSYGISMNSYNGSASNQPSGGDNANSVMNICNTKHGTSGVYGWQIAFENHNILVRKWSAGSKTGWYTLWHSGNMSMSDYLLKTGGTLTGKLTIQSSSMNGAYNGLLVGDDCNIGDCNLGNTIGLMGTTNNNAGMVKFGKGGYQFGYNGTNHYVSGTGLFTNLNADLLDGLHASSFIKRFDISLSNGTTSSVDVYTKNSETTREAGNILSVNGWANSAYIKLNSNYTVDRQRYSIFVYRNGNVNNSWNQQALMFLPTYDDNTIYLAQMNTNDTGGAVSTRIKRFIDYDTTVSDLTSSFKTSLKKARVPGEMVDFYVYSVNGYTCTSTNYTTFRNQLFESSGRGKSSVTYKATSSSISYTVDLSDFILAYNGITAYSNGCYTAGAGEADTNRVGQVVGANSKSINGSQMPKHAHWFGHYRSDNANDRDVFGPDGGQNWSTNGTSSAGQGGNWRTGYSGNGSSIDFRPKTILVFKMIYAPQSW